MNSNDRNSSQNSNSHRRWKRSNPQITKQSTPNNNLPFFTTLEFSSWSLPQFYSTVPVLVFPFYIRIRSKSTKVLEL